MMQKRYENEVTKLSQNSHSFCSVHVSQTGHIADQAKGNLPLWDTWRLCDTDWGTDLSDYCWVCDLVEKSQPLCIVRYCMSIVLQVTVLQESEAEKSLPTRIEATANK